MELIFLGSGLIGGLIGGGLGILVKGEAWRGFLIGVSAGIALAVTFLAVAFSGG